MNYEYKHLDKYERKIILFLYSLGEMVSTRAIANKLDIHWSTAKKSLKSLEEKGVVRKISMANKKLWSLSKI